MNPVLVVTGGSRGIGAETARLAALRGYAVCVNYRSNRAAADAVVAAIERGGTKIAVAADVGVEPDVLRLFETVDQQLGRLSALVNNAGILETQARLDAMDAARISRVFATNVTGPFLCAREAVRRMSTRYGGTGGAIVNVSSGASRLGSPHEYIDYAATKGALDTMTIGLSREVAAGFVSRRPCRTSTPVARQRRRADRVERVKSQVPMGGAPERSRAPSCGCCRTTPPHHRRLSRRRRREMSTVDAAAAGHHALAAAAAVREEDAEATARL